MKKHLMVTLLMGMGFCGNTWSGQPERNDGVHGWNGSENIEIGSRPRPPIPPLLDDKSLNNIVARPRPPIPPK